MAEHCIGLIGGTGLGHALADRLQGDAITVDTPFGAPSASILMGTLDGVKIAFLPRHGKDHSFPPSAVPYRANIFALKKVGVTHIIASGATGSLREEIRPGDLVIPDQVIDKTYRRRSSFFDEAGGAVHVEFHAPFCSQLRNLLLNSGKDIDAAPPTDGGTYVCMEGPAFSTEAESRMHRAWGGDLIGMTCMPEAKLAREAEMCFGLLALPTDYDCWRPHPEGMDSRELLKEIMGNLELATSRSVALIEAALKHVASLPLDCTCHRALDMAVWTRPDSIDASLKTKMAPILARRLGLNNG